MNRPPQNGWAERAAARLLQRSDVVAVWLGGSLATDEADEVSDVDLRVAVTAEALPAWRQPDFPTWFGCDANGHAMQDWLRGKGGFEIVENDLGCFAISGGPPARAHGWSVADPHPVLDLRDAVVRLPHRQQTRDGIHCRGHRQPVLSRPLGKEGPRPMTGRHLS
jgi:hypothetical protein